MKNDMDYLNYDDLNKVENDIETKTNEIKATSTIPTYKKKNWVVDELPYIEEIDRIEKGVENLGEYTEKPNNWKPTKQWANDDGSYGLKSFDYHDYNRWLKDISLIDTTNLDKDTYWNGFSLVNWDETSKYDWTEKKQDRTFKGIIIKLFSKIKRMIKFIRLKGFTRQEKTEGYNLCGTSKDYEITKSNVTLKVEGDVYTLNGTTNNNEYIDFDVLEPIMLDSKTQYTIKTFYLSGNSNKQAYIWLHNSVNKQGIISQFFGNENSIRINDAQELNLNENYIRIKPNAVLNNYKFKILCYKGKIDKPYEPYTGGTASPNPDYPQEIEVGKGKNLFDKDNAKFVQGYFAGGNTISMSGNDRIIYIKCKPNTTYTITKAVNKETAKNRFNVGTTNKKPEPGTAILNKKLNPDGTTKKSESITTANNSNYLIVFIYTKSTEQTFEELLSSVMIYEGTEATSYEPYNTIEVKSTGKNLFDVKKVIKGKVPSTNGGNLVNLSYGGYIRFNIDNKKEYNWSYKKESYIFLYDENNNYLKHVQATFNAGYNLSKIPFYDKTKYILIRFDSYENIKDNDPMFIQNNLKLPYEPYRESKVQYALQDNFLADKDYIINGKLFKNTNEIILTGEEKWTLNGSKKLFYAYFENKKPVKLKIEQSNCNYFKPVFQQFGTSEYGVFIDDDVTTSAGTATYFRPINAEMEGNLNAFKQWLKDKYNSGNPVKVLYETATTTEIPLKTTGELTLDKGDNIISNSIDTENTIGYEEE